MKKLLFIISLMPCLLTCMQHMTLDSRALCPTSCPTGSAQFCSLCVSNTAVINNLTVQGTLNVCSGITGMLPCACIFDGEISWNTDESHCNIKQQTGSVAPTPFQPYFNNGYLSTFTGWPVHPSDAEIPLVITAEFQVPLDLDPSVTPTITLHWFNQDATFNDCTGDYINWQINADFFVNNANIDYPVAVPKYVLATGDILLTDYTGPEPDGYVQQQITVPLTGPALVPGAYAQISVMRIAPTGMGHVESDCDSLLTLISFQYQKRAQ